MNKDLAAAILESAKRMQVDPRDLATIISYETAGTFDPWKAGPTTQWGQHRGLIQWGEPQRAKYGVREGMPVRDQMTAVERYMADAGVKPGMGILDLYSAVNAGKVGRYNASDANNGGAPGTVRDKVEKQMGGHRLKAEALLGPDGVLGGPPTQMAAAPTTLGQTEGQPAPAWSPLGANIVPMAAPEPAVNLQAMFQQQQADAEKQALMQQAEQTRKKALFAQMGANFA